MFAAFSCVQRAIDTDLCRVDCPCVFLEWHVCVKHVALGRHIFAKRNREANEAIEVHAPRGLYCSTPLVDWWTSAASSSDGLKLARERKSLSHGDVFHVPPAVYGAGVSISVYSCLLEMHWTCWSEWFVWT